MMCVYDVCMCVCVYVVCVCGLLCGSFAMLDVNMCVLLLAVLARKRSRCVTPAIPRISLSLIPPPST